MKTADTMAPATSERKANELCGDEVFRGIRCMRPKDHDGDHECYPVNRDRVRWR